MKPKFGWSVWAIFTVLYCTIFIVGGVPLKFWFALPHSCPILAPNCSAYHPLAVTVDYFALLYDLLIWVPVCGVVLWLMKDGKK